MIIDQKPREFPPPKLVVEERNGRTVALLLSDDPPEALNPNYTGNSYYIEMTFDEKLKDLAGHEWVYEAPSADRLESTNGIFLEGNRKQLQPFQVKIKFQADPGGDIVWIGGTFYEFMETDPPTAPRMVPVAGRLILPVAEKIKPK